MTWQAWESQFSIRLKGECRCDARSLDGKPHDLTKRRNEIWGGIPRSSFFATFAFFAAKHQSRVRSFSIERGKSAAIGITYDESLSFLRGYGAGRRGQGNERDAATRHLRGRCAANVTHRPAFAKARRFSRRPARRPRRGLESLGRVRPRPPQFTSNQIALRLQRTLMCGGSEAGERRPKRVDTAYPPRVPRGGAFGHRRTNRTAHFACFGCGWKDG